MKKYDANEVPTIEILEVEQVGTGPANTFLAKEHLVKNWLTSTQDKVIYFQRTIFQPSTKPLFTSQKGGDQRKNYPFFKHASSRVAPA
jgi:hypothetical protein